MTVHLIEHPLIRHKIGLLRRHDISTKHFRELACEVSTMLTYEATKNMEMEPHTIKGWAGDVVIERVRGKKISIVPILRAGFGMLDGVLSVIPSARISVVGLYRNEETLQPVPYFQKIIKDIASRMALIVDPMLATGGTFNATVDMVKTAGCKNIKGLFLVAAPEGIKAVSAKHPDVEVFTAAVDDCLNDVGYILPGLGDAGDKIFGTK